MAWRIVWSREAASFMSQLERKDAQRIFKKIEVASRDPVRFFSRLSGRDDYKLRAGDYRVLALLIHVENTLFIEKVGHRKNIYSD